MQIDLYILTVYFYSCTINFNYVDMSLRRDEIRQMSLLHILLVHHVII